MSFDEKEIPLFSDAEPLRSEPRGFTVEQMVTCEGCLRANPPTRTSCLYCAAPLHVTEQSAALLKPTLHRLEEWERGFNVIYLPERAGRLTDPTLQEIAVLLRLEQDDLRRIVDQGKPMPVARATSREEAGLIESRLATLGVGATLIADFDLIGDDPLPRRVRALELSDAELSARPAAGSAEIWRVAWSEITLMVAGRLFTRQLEVEERKRRKAEGEIVDARELSTDEPVLDIYSDQSERGWRLSAAGFDFSCLGPRKGLIAGQNFSTLIALLRERADKACYDESYTRARHALAPVWTPGQHTEGRGWRRTRPGRVNTEVVTTTSNDLQFTRYSRLLNYLRLHQPEPSK